MRKIRWGATSLVSVGLAVAGLATVETASATEGYLQNGIGARGKALAGAGVADGQDATAIALNPAALVNAGHELDVAVSLFAPDRGFTGSGGPGFTPSGAVDGNESKIFLVPDIAYARPWGEHGAIGISIDGVGGMNTDYAAVANPACGQPGMPAPNGVFCGGEAGVDLMQALIHVGYAHQFEGFSVGVAPILAVQAFEAKGLAVFGGISSDPTNLTNKDHSMSTGVGVRLGAQVDLTDFLRFGATYQTKINMSEFDDYSGLFAGGGDFDIPENFQLGFAYDAMENLTVMLDYRRIAYGDVDSIANPMTNPYPLGLAKGPGFHWQDMDAWKLGAEYNAGNGLTLRGGISTNDNPVQSDAVTFNILAPGVVTKHFTAGFEKEFAGKGSLQAALMYAPEETVSGIEITPLGPNPGHSIELRMDQLEFTVGWKFKFGQ